MFKKDNTIIGLVKITKFQQSLFTSYLSLSKSVKYNRCSSPQLVEKEGYMWTNYACLNMTLYLACEWIPPAAKRATETHVSRRHQVSQNRLERTK